MIERTAVVCRVLRDENHRLRKHAGICLEW
jgi:hypothetical protein